MSIDLVQKAITWVLSQEIRYGEVGLIFKFHDGQLRCIETSRKKKIAVTEGEINEPLR
jgi:DNA polymerase III sliding clamp (beta) subunit (PCNA family)